MTFATSLFDASFEFVASDPRRQDLVKPTRQERRSRPTWQLRDDELLALAAPEADLTVLASRGGGSAAEALHGEQTIADLKAALVAGPVEARLLQRRLWPEHPEAPRMLESLVALGSRVHDEAGNPVLSARYHLFVRATEGAFVSFTDSGPRIFLGRHEIDPDTGRAVFEFGTCQRCGAVHLAGDVEHRSQQQYFVPSAKNDAAVKWLVLTDGTAESTVFMCGVRAPGRFRHGVLSGPVPRWWGAAGPRAQGHGRCDEPLHRVWGAGPSGGAPAANRRQCGTGGDHHRPVSGAADRHR